MTLQDFEQLTTPDNLALIEQHINDTPERLAFKLRNAPLVSWIRNLQKCRRKLPLYFTHRCFVSSIGFQQSSSQVAAEAKMFDMLPVRGLAVDLTCGLGVDSWAISRHFERVISIEADAVRAAVARYNFNQLGVSNIEVVHGRAETFDIPKDTDLIYIDPSRETDDGQRVYSLTQSSPDITQLMPRLRCNARAVMVKLSPMYDVGEAFTVFPDAAIEVVSLDGECKEVLIEYGFSAEPELICTAIRGGKVARIVFQKHETEKNHVINNAPWAEFEWLLMPDVVFYKSRTVEAYARRLEGVEIYGGYLFSHTQADESFMGRCYRIEQTADYQPKTLKKTLKAAGIRRANLHLRDFPQSAAEVAAALGIAQGGGHELFFTRIAGKPIVFFVSLHA